MTTKSPRKRLCWNCEGSVSIAEEICPFCGVSVVPAFLEGAGTHFAPPYSTSDQKDFDPPKSPYSIDVELPQLADNETREPEEEEPSFDEFKRVVVAVLLLLSGSVFFLFSLALGLFSRNGVFTLHWNGTIWFVYMFLALPLLFLGWKSLMKLDQF